MPLLRHDAKLVWQELGVVLGALLYWVTSSKLVHVPVTVATQTEPARPVSFMQTLKMRRDGCSRGQDRKGQQSWKWIAEIALCGAGKSL